LKDWSALSISFYRSRLLFYSVGYSVARLIIARIAMIAKIAGIDDWVSGTHQSSILAITNPGNF